MSIEVSHILGGVDILYADVRAMLLKSRVYLLDHAITWFLLGSSILITADNLVW